MNLGRFSLSLTVKDIKASRAFYEGFGFTVYDNHEDQHWMILRNGETTIGLFQGMFDDNILTFATPDVRSLQKALLAKGISPVVAADPEGRGPCHIILKDPDGNTVMCDQHDPNYQPTSTQPD